MEKFAEGSSNFHWTLFRDEMTGPNDNNVGLHVARESGYEEFLTSPDASLARDGENWDLQFSSIERANFFGRAVGGTIIR